ncbi:neuromedin-U receptor 2-like [Galleria mellonella]|uniref:Neuromedin-U receptor 2-like n=1 Tax=Galleria mellonella TaxID=7137 RepID=A0A6J1WPH4_GALME|nr:neuromedin-U receptor 2-like [Galleria mellonella]
MTNITAHEDFDYQLWAQILKKSMTPESDVMHAVYAATLLIIFVVGVTGNLLTCTVIYLDRNMHTATNYYLFNLAISDFIVSFGILLEVNIIWYMPNFYYFQDYDLGNVVCKIHFFLVVALWNNGILIMTTLAIERYIAIWHPLLLKSTPVWRRCMKTIILIWTVAILETLPEVWTVNLINADKSPICFIIPTPFAKVINAVLGLVTFIIPLGIMTFVYSMIAFKVNVSQTSDSRDRIFNHRNNRSKVNKLIVALTLSFLVCWLPFFTLRVLIVMSNTQLLEWLAERWELWLSISSINNWFSIILNPLLFSLMSTKFRRALKTLWNTKIMRRTPVPHRVTL